MSKSFKIARKPGQSTSEVQTAAVGEASAAAPSQRTRQIRGIASGAGAQPVISATRSATTRKTIEVPEDYFYKVKLRALERHMLEKELWAEIVGDYFAHHPEV